MQLNFDKNGGVVIAIAQDFNTGQVLMVGHASPEAVRKSFEDGLATFWSMSRNELWTKGLTSGDTLKVREIRTDCDRDAVLYLVEPQGPGGACHKDGWHSCFKQRLVYGFTPPLSIVGKPDSFKAGQLTEYRVKESSMEAPTFSRLFAEEEEMIKMRVDAKPERSHTAKSLLEPMARVAQKIGEEGLEVALALTDPDQDNQTVINEAADLLYRLQIGLVKADINWSDVEAEIVRRRK